MCALIYSMCVLGQVPHSQASDLRSTLPTARLPGAAKAELRILLNGIKGKTRWILLSFIVLGLDTEQHLLGGVLIFARTPENNLSVLLLTD